MIPADRLAALAELVEARGGLRFAGSRRAELASKAERAFAASGCETWESWLEQLGRPGGAAAMQQLLETLTVGETYFFRHRSYFEVLERDVLPELIDRNRQVRQLRLWCAGCASGEEAYSLAIVVRRLLPDIDQWQVRILGTDLNRASLARAREGVYSQWSFRETDAAFKRAYFVSDGRQYRIRPEYQRLVSFEHLNLVEDGYPSFSNGTAALDLILCRNVLIYFAPDLARQVVGRLRESLVTGGWLVLGPSDPLPGLMSGFDIQAAQDAIVYRRVDPARPTRVAPELRQRGADIPLSQPEAPAADIASVAPTAWTDAWQAACASANSGRLDEAELYCQRVISSAAMRPEPHYLLGVLHQTRGNDEAALAAFRRALYVDHAFVPALVAVAGLHRRRGSPERARRSLIRARSLLEGRASDEPILAEEGLTVGKLQAALANARPDQTEPRT